MIIISRLPNMSASLDMIGVATALVSSVAVTSQDASSGLTPRMAGNSGSSGTTIVCCSATTVPDRDRIAMTAQVGRVLGRVAAIAGSSRGDIPKGTVSLGSSAHPALSRLIRPG